MPIANCIMTLDLAGGVPSGKDLISRWAEISGTSADHMTINLIQAVAQYGVAYRLMADLQLPDLWSADKCRAIQEGLASALSDIFEIPLAEIHVVTQMVSTGQVVEDGKTEIW